MLYFLKPFIPRPKLNISYNFTQGICLKDDQRQAGINLGRFIYMIIEIIGPNGRPMRSVMPINQSLTSVIVIKARYYKLLSYFQIK